MEPTALLSGVKTRSVLGGHETFAFRNGWLKKGVDAVAEKGQIFTQDDALITLGVGKNMVRSIRHWCLATKLLEELPSEGRSHTLTPTWLAKKLFLDDKWDPYLEKEGSLWLMHWQIATNKVRSLIWGIVFSEYLETEFTKQSLANYLSRQLAHYDVKTTNDMILRELDCCFHTYITTKASIKQKNNSNGIAEDNLDCPLAELELIRYMPEYELYHFNIGPKSTLPVEIFGYALLLFISSLSRQHSTIALEECMYKPDSPGQVFKLDENSVVEYVNEIERKFSGKLRLIETAGLNQIYLSEEITSNIENSSRSFLASYYE